MSVRIGDEAPNFTAETTEGTIKFHDWIGDGWAVLFSHPKDFTPVCTTELGYMARLEAGVRQAQHQGHRPVSIDPVDDHERWAKDIEETQGHGAELSDDRRRRPQRREALRHDPSQRQRRGKRTAADNATVRSVFIVGPDKKIKSILTYPMSTGRNFDEVLRVLDSIQLTAKHKVATPVNWKQGEDVIIVRRRSPTRTRRRSTRTAGRRRSRICGSSRSRSRDPAPASLLEASALHGHPLEKGKKVELTSTAGIRLPVGTRMSQ